MNKIDIIKILAEKKRLKIHDAEKIVSVIVEEISKTLIVGGRAEFRGFGAFFTKLRKKRSARNPKTGEMIEVRAKKIPHFRMAKNFFNQINNGN